MKYYLSKEAQEDLENIWLYTLEHWSVEQADRYLNIIMDEIEHVSANPSIGKDYGRLRKGYYRVLIKSHIIFYRNKKSESAIEIIRILHQKMDIESHL